MDESYVTYKHLLNEFLNFPSVSTDPSHSKDINNTALWLEKTFKSNGFATQIWRTENTNPVVFSEFLPLNTDHRSLTTVLIYGHYDVQPASKTEGWATDPFTLGEDKNRFYGRGVIDNKGQVLVHIATVINLIKQGRLKHNVKFIIEGNEETGNNSLSTSVKKHAVELTCDFVLVSDGELTNNQPTIEVSLRGGFNCTLTYTTAKNNLHSGMWGGSVPNAAHELSKFIAKLFDGNGSVIFKEFYLDLDVPTRSQLENNQRLAKQSGVLTKLAGVKKLIIDPLYDFFTTTGLRPTIQVTGFKSGYVDAGYSNIIPAEAEVRLNFRLAPSQKSKNISEAFAEYVKKNVPKHVDYKLVFNGPHEPIKVSVDNKYLIQIEKILEKVYKQKVNRRNVGGAIPFVADVKSILGVDAVLVPLANKDCNMHGANENFDKKYLKKALEFSNDFFQTTL